MVTDLGVVSQKKSLVLEEFDEVVGGGGLCLMGK